MKPDYTHSSIIKTQRVFLDIAGAVLLILGIVNLVVKEIPGGWWIIVAGILCFPTASVLRALCVMTRAAETKLAESGDKDFIDVFDEEDKE